MDSFLYDRDLCHERIKQYRSENCDQVNRSYPSQGIGHKDMIDFLNN